MPLSDFPRERIAVETTRSIKRLLFDAWRLAEAKLKGVPAFRILTDRALQAIAEKQPLSTRELLEVPGVGLTIVEKYGAQIFQIVERAK